MRIYVDVTETVAERLRTGIQRVVRAIMEQALEVSKKLNVEIVPVVAVGNKFYPLDDPDKLFKPVPVEPPSRLRQAVGICFRHFPGIKSKIRKLMLYMFAVREAGKQSSAPISPEKNDVLLLLDSFWGTQRAIAPAARIHLGGGIVILVICDMFPITHPQYCDDYNAVSFVENLGKLLEVSNGIMTISLSGVGEVGRVLSSISPKNASRLKLEYFYLGADFPHNALAKNEENDWPRGLWVEGVPVYLMVGTIEPRKRHEFVLDVFESRWERGETDKLLIVGKVGWKTEDLAERILSSPHYGSRLYMVNDASDAKLEDAYKRAYACIMASEIEGFGLPVIEALQRRLPVLASDIPVFREIGGKFCRYFALNDAASLDRTIDELSANIDDARALVDDFKWLTWRESAEQLFGKVIKMAGDA